MDKGASARALLGSVGRLAIGPARRPRCGPCLTALIALVALLSTLFLADASADVNRWTTSVPEGGNVNSLVIDPSAPATLYAGPGGGVFDYEALAPCTPGPSRHCPPRRVPFR